MKFSIYRFNPEHDAKPFMQDFEQPIGADDHMLLDVILRIKAQDNTLTIRKSCREGVCGSDGSTSTAATDWRASRECAI